MSGHENDGGTIVISLDAIWNKLREMKDPQRKRDLVSLGFIQDISLDGGKVYVDVSPDGIDEAQVEAMAGAVSRELGAIGGVESVVIRTGKSSPKHSVPPPELESDGASAMPVDFAPGAGYRPEGPDPLDGPGSTDPEEGQLASYKGVVPVFQWEIDPADTALKGGEVFQESDGWEFRIWWKQHPAELIYASIQAMRNDPGDERPGVRPHPMGRTVAVNLVYDPRRGGFVAIYGTALDFRPFVRAFCRAYGLSDSDAGQETDKAKKG